MSGRRHFVEMGIIVGVVALGTYYWSQGERPKPSPTVSKSISPTWSDKKAPVKPAENLISLSDQKTAVTREAIKVDMDTDVGFLTLAVYPKAAPNAAARLLELMDSGFYNNTPIFRVVPGFVVQFGINSDPKHRTWKDKNFDDDPCLAKAEPGTLAFAKSGPDTNSTQLFINLSDNTQALTPMNFAPFARVTSGNKLLTKFPQVGDPSMGLPQESLWADTPGFLKGLPKKPAMIRFFRVHYDE